jgi:transposase-like protein
MNSIKETMLRREWLCRNAPSCPACGESKQIQLVEWICRPPADWRCRTCKHKFSYEPPVPE